MIIRANSKLEIGDFKLQLKLKFSLPNQYFVHVFNRISKMYSTCSMFLSLVKDELIAILLQSTRLEAQGSYFEIFLSKQIQFFPN